jgi:hypothetical protein
VRPGSLAVATVALATVISVACGIDVTGASAGPTDDAGAESGADARSGAPEGLVGGGDSDSVGFDAGVADAACTPTTIDDPLQAIDGTRWISQETNNNGRPTPVQANPNKIISFIGSDRSGARGALWLVNAVPTQALDVQFRFAVDCGPYIWSGCADGLAVAWLEVGGLGPGALAPALGNAGTGNGFGIPTGLAGAAVSVDIYTNSGDPQTPALEILDVDGVRTPGGYPWIVQSSSNDDYGGSNAHTMRLHLRKGLLTASVDGKDVLTDVAVRPTKQSGFGFTAATGGDNGVFYVWDFHAAFFDCDP